LLRRARELGTAHTRWHDDIAEQQVDGCFILKNGEGLGTGSGCSVSASNMNFGSASLLSSALSATGQISVSCNASLPVTIALDNGATGTGPTNRLMTAGGNSIQYGIYKDSAHNQPWGNSVGTNTASGTGSKFRCVAGRSAAGGCSAS